MEIRNNAGEFVLKQAIGLLIFVMVLSSTLAIYHVYYVIGTVREKTNEAVLAVASSNVAEFYGGARESDGYARHPEDGAFSFSISTEDVLDNLLSSTGAVETGDGTLKRESFSIRNLNTDFINYDGKDLHFTTTLRVEVPLVGGGFALTSIQKNLEVESCYAPKF